MPDQLYLSYWLRGFTESNMLRHYERLLKLFPYSRLTGQPAVFRVLPVDYQQPAIFERAYPQPLDFEQVLAAAKDFQHADSSYRLETAWDLWQYDTDWQLAPARVALCCFGPAFENDTGENLGVEFGIDTHFLPQPDIPGSGRMVQSNIRSLLKLVHDIDDRMGAERRLLSTESGVNFHEKLQEALARESVPGER